MSKKHAPKMEDTIEVSWTVRMPRALAEAIKAHAESLTAEGRGKWSGNMVIVDALTRSLKARQAEIDK